MKEANQQQFTKEKQQSILINDYKQAIALLRRQETKGQGKGQLLKIFNHNDIMESSLRQLRLCTLLSLGEISKQQNNPKLALYYWYQSLKIEGNFKVWIKMAQVLQQLKQSVMRGEQTILNIYQLQLQIQHAYKNAIAESPKVWRTKLVNKLEKVYTEHGKQIQLEDLQNLKNKENLIDEIISNRRQRENQEDSKARGSTKDPALEKQALENLSFVEKVQTQQIRILFKAQQSYQQNVPSLDYLLIVANSLMSQPTTSKKPSKKYEQIINRLSKYDPLSTRFTLNSQIKKAEVGRVQKIPDQSKMQQQLNVGREAEHEIEKHQDKGEVKRKESEIDTCSKKQIQQALYLEKTQNFFFDSYKQLLKEKEVGSIKTKKSQISTTLSTSKTNFQSLPQYFRQVSFKLIDLELFNSLRYVDALSNPIFAPFISAQNTFDTTLSPILEKIKKYSLEKDKERERDREREREREKDRDKQNNMNAIQNEEQQTINLRERRLNISTADSQPLYTPHQRRIEDNRIQQLILEKIKNEIRQWLGCEVQRKYLNVISFSEQLLSFIIKIYEKYSFIENLESQQNEQVLKITNKLIGILIYKIWELHYLGAFLSDSWRRKNIIYLIAIKFIDQQSSSSNIKIQDFQIYLLSHLQNELHRRIYSKTKWIMGSSILVDSLSRMKAQNKPYQEQQLRQILQLLHIGILLCSSPFFVQQEKINSFFKYYETFYNMYFHNENQLVLKSINQALADPQSLKEKIENRISKSKLKQLSQQECQQSTLMTSIDKLLKNDMQTSEIIESVKSIVGINPTLVSIYLKSFNMVADHLFTNLDTSNLNLNVKLIQNMLKQLQIPRLIQLLHTKLTEDQKNVKGKNQNNNDIKPSLQLKKVLQQRQLQEKLKIQTLYNLIKIYLLNQLDQQYSNLCLRIVFYLTEDCLKTLDQLHKIWEAESAIQHKNIHYQNQEQICKIIIIFDSLIKLKESSEIRKRFYNRILLKNIRYIYDQYQAEHVGLQSQQIRSQIYKIFNETFHSKNFKPKKIQDCLAYFLMISREYASEFDKQEVEFQQKMKKLFNECYLIFKEQFPIDYPFCQRFNRAIQYFVCVMRKKKVKECEEFINFFTCKQIICQCCQMPYINNSIESQQYAKEVILIVAKFLENRKNQQKNGKNVRKQQKQPIQQQRKSFIQLEDQIQKYYLQYFILALNTGKAWHQILRFQICKVYQHFDSLLAINAPEPSPFQTAHQSSPDSILQQYKHKFKYAKVIASFIVRNLTTDRYQQAKQYAIYRVNIINALKISERKLNKKLSQLGSVSTHVKYHSNKYMEGVITLMVRKNQDEQFNNGNNLPQISYLSYTQYTLPHAVMLFERGDELNPEISILQKSIKEGFDLVKRLSGNEKPYINMDMIQIQQGEGVGATQSKYQTKHLGKQLKVSIIIGITQLILSTFKYIEEDSEKMKSRQANKNKLEDAPIFTQAKYNYKTQLLQEIVRILRRHEQQIRSWRVKNQPVKREYSMEDEQQNQKKLQFKYKYQILDYTQTFSEAQQFLQLFVQILDQLGKNNIQGRLKKENYSRYIFNANLWCSKIYHYFDKRQMCLNYLKELSNLKNEDLVTLYHHYENQPTELNEVLAEFYSRDIVFHYLKIQGIEHLLEIYSSRNETLEICLTMIRKLLKLAIVRVEVEKDRQKDRQKGKEKDKDKDKTKQQTNENQMKRKEQTEEVKNKEEKQKEVGQKDKGKKGKKEGKMNKEKQKAASKIERKIRWLYILFLKGVELYLRAFQNFVEAKNQPMDVKFQKALREFKNKVKKDTEKERKINLKDVHSAQKLFGIRLGNELENYIAYYERKFDRKIRMKTAKKSKVQQAQLQGKLKAQQLKYQHTEAKVEGTKGKKAEQLESEEDDSQNSDVIEIQNQERIDEKDEELMEERGQKQQKQYGDDNDDKGFYRQQENEDSED